MDSSLRPRRARDLELSAVTDGFVVSRPGNDRIHFLNPTAAFILESCDGTIQGREFPDLVAGAFGLETPPTAEVEACLATLLSEGLLLIDDSVARK